MTLNWVFTILRTTLHFELNFSLERKSLKTYILHYIYYYRDLVLYRDAKFICKLQISFAIMYFYFFSSLNRTIVDLA